MESENGFSLRFGWRGACECKIRDAQISLVENFVWQQFTPEYKLGILQEIDEQSGEGRGVVGDISKHPIRQHLIPPHEHSEELWPTKTFDLAFP
jgi:hypothetical protein